MPHLTIHCCIKSSRSAEEYKNKPFQNLLQDYLIAQGTGQYHPGLLHRKTLKYCFSQDGAKWIDLETISPEVASKAATVTGMLSGEPAKAYKIQEPGAPPVPEGEVSP